jgi:hypothetical protein
VNHRNGHRLRPLDARVGSVQHCSLATPPARGDSPRYAAMNGTGGLASRPARVVQAIPKDTQSDGRPRPSCGADCRE